MMYPVSVLISLALLGVVNSKGIVPVVADQCFEPVSPGPCRAFIPSFYFNPLTGSCDCFVFGGCQANGNKFDRLDECMNTCSVRPQLQDISPTCIRIFGADNNNFIMTPRPITPRPVTFSPANQLPIATAFPAMPAKDIPTTTAAPITSAPTKAAPTTAAPTTPAPTTPVPTTAAPTTPVPTTAVPTTATSTTSAPVRPAGPVADQCFEPVSPGPCRAFIPSFYFNPLTGSCDCFVFGGCQANGNKFAHLDECMNTCSVRPQFQAISPTCIRIFGADNNNFITTPRPITPRPVTFSPANQLTIDTPFPAVSAKDIPTTTAAPITSAPTKAAPTTPVPTTAAPTTATSTTSAPVRPAGPVVTAAPARAISNTVHTPGTTNKQGNLISRNNKDVEGAVIAGSTFSQNGVSGQTTITIGQPVFIWSKK